MPKLTMMLSGIHYARYCTFPKAASMLQHAN